MHTRDSCLANIYVFKDKETVSCVYSYQQSWRRGWFQEAACRLVKSDVGRSRAILTWRAMSNGRGLGMRSASMQQVLCSLKCVLVSLLIHNGIELLMTWPKRGNSLRTLRKSFIKRATSFWKWQKRSLGIDHPLANSWTSLLNIIAISSIWKWAVSSEIITPYICPRQITLLDRVIKSIVTV